MRHDDDDMLWNGSE